MRYSGIRARDVALPLLWYDSGREEIWPECS